jgi:hypothetical protein
MRRTFSGLRDFYEFLKRTEDFMRSPEAVLRLAWKPGEPPEDENQEEERPIGERRPGGLANAKMKTEGPAKGEKKPESGVWVELVEPDDRRNEPESTFRTFLDENNGEVYEADLPEQEEGRKRRVCFEFPESRKIEIVDRDPDRNHLLLERMPTQPFLLLRPNTYPLMCQLRALKHLQDAPDPAYIPLLRLLESSDHARWPEFSTADLELEWQILMDETRPGTSAQRRFVEMALTTPDFAFLEGPPGSGKTTAICELVLQLVKEGKRVLLCASTHVAVDNVLERLVADGEVPPVDGGWNDLIAVRIGDRRSISDAVRPFQLQESVKTEHRRLVDFLGRQRPRSEAQEALLQALRHGVGDVERLVLDAANLVCGTTIGILQHPDIKQRRDAGAWASPQFDMLILDEASKTPFQEFLVPALLAKRWIVVGDPKQLSPYVDEQAVEVNLAACVRNEIERRACVDVFVASQGDGKRRTTLVVTDDEPEEDAYIAECSEAGVCIARGGTDSDLGIADIVVCSPEELPGCIDQLPLDILTVRSDDDLPDRLGRRIDAWRNRVGRQREEDPLWEAEVAWRLIRHYELRRSPGDTVMRLLDDVKRLVPVKNGARDLAGIWDDVDRVRRVALPSVLESLQQGFERSTRQRSGTALSDGLPADRFAERHVLLEYQLRMHPEISAFSRQHIYDGSALKDPDDMAGRRVWSYGRYSHRSVWIDVRGRFDGFNRNRDEARATTREVEAFCSWASTNPCPENRPWEAAVITFYRGQERELRDCLRRSTRQLGGHRHFHVGRGSPPAVHIQLCTVDRFQGHEADIVFISFANPRSTNFLESPNRLNVALTRARYQRVLIGFRGDPADKKRRGLIHSKGDVLRALAEGEHWVREFGGDR